MHYTLEDFHNCAITENILSETIKTNITNLYSLLNIDINEVKKPRRQKHENRNDIWEKMKPLPEFKATKMDEKVGLDKLMSKVKASLNKLSVQNYEVEKNTILDSMEPIFEQENGESVLINTIIEIACINHFYCKFYVKLLGEMFSKYPSLNELFIKYDIIESYKTKLNQIEFIDSDVDFNQYCLNNKNNDKRKGLCKFITELIEYQIYDEQNIYDLFNFLFQLLEKNQDNASLLQINEEIIENIYVLVSNSIDIIKEQEYMDNIKTKIFESKNKKIYKGISTRITFKFMDIYYLF